MPIIADIMQQLDNWPRAGRLPSRSRSCLITLELEVDVTHHFERGYPATPESPAEPAGEEIDDVFLEVDGQQVSIHSLLTDKELAQLREQLD